IPGELSKDEPDIATSSAGADTRSICYIGGVTRVRGAVEMIRALEHTNARLILAGPMESDAFYAELRALPGWNKIDYRGVLDRDAIRQVLSEAQLGLVLLHPVPNYLDALPVKMFEYMAAGVPILASDFPLWRGILESSGPGYCVAPLDPNAIADAIESMLSMSPEQRQAIRLACYKAAKD
ncbi:glycosyltransferase, partial [Escherichia coli]